MGHNRNHSHHAPCRVLVPGNLDGVHLGHRSLLVRAGEVAQRLQTTGGGRVTVAALTFSPHPAQFLGTNPDIRFLTTPARKRELLLHYGAHEVLEQTFDETFAQVSTTEFARRYVAQTWHARAVVVGPDFRFGKGRTGDMATLRQLGKTLGDAFDFEVVQAAPALVQGEVVSSSRIRTLLADGDVQRAAMHLGRPYDLDGVVVHGQKRGRVLGFATANLHCEPSVVIPKRGVYAVRATRVATTPNADDTDQTPHTAHAGTPERMNGVMNIGVRPTVCAGEPEQMTLEVHLLGFHGTLYDQSLRVEFVTRIRDEHRFESTEDLSRQIARDVAVAEQVLVA
jgi:riboflavin kinase/FMN adenylyltransferase